MKSIVYKKKFQEGFESSFKISAGSKSAKVGYKYVRTVESTIDELDNAMNRPYYGSRAPTASIRGFVGEEHTAGSFNIHAAVSGSKERAATVNITPVIDSETGEILCAPVRGGLGSPDIVTTFGENYGLKYYQNGIKSVLSQAKTLNERYVKYLKKHPDVDLDTYCKLFNIEEGITIDDSIYKYQKMLIPTDQLSEGEKYALRRIMKAIEKGSAKRITFEEVYDSLTDRISSPDGIESDPYTKEMAEFDAELARKGLYNPAMDGYSLEELIKFKQIINQGVKAGERAAITTVAIKIGPEVCNLILLFIKNESVSKEDFKKLGIKALSAASQGYINGFLAGSFTTACTAGHLGFLYENVDPSIIGAITSFISATIVDSIKACCGEIDYVSCIDNTIRNFMVTGGAVIGGKLMESIIYIPVISYMVGSFVGASLTAGIYSAAKESYLSYVLDKGLTVFGLVDQDYSIPEDALREIGVNVFKYDRFEFINYKMKDFSIRKYKESVYNYHTAISFTVVKRGLIGINKVGYIVDK